MIKLSSASRFSKSALLAAFCTFAVAVAPISVTAADAAKSASSEAGQALPITATVEKGQATEGGPFSVKLKNDSKETLSVQIKVLLAVAFHAENKARNLPETSIKAGETFTVPGLAAEDKVVVTAKGRAPLTVVVK